MHVRLISEQVGYMLCGSCVLLLNDVDDQRRCVLGVSFAEAERGRLVRRDDYLRHGHTHTHLDHYWR